jgi:hypothetical protein
LHEPHQPKRKTGGWGCFERIQLQFEDKFWVLQETEIRKKGFSSSSQEKMRKKERAYYCVVGRVKVFYFFGTKSFNSGGS